VLDWVYANFRAPEQIFVTGCSAGSYGSALWSSHIMEHYPDSRVIQFGDSGAGVITQSFFADSFPIWQAQDAFPSWIPSLDPNTNDLLQAELTQCAVTLRNYIEEQLHTAFVAPGDIDGLRGFLQFATPATQTGSIGNVARNATYHFNQYQQIAGGFMSAGIPAWTKLYRECSQFGRRPDVMLVDPAVYDGYEEWCGPERALVDEDMGSAGFTALRFKGALVIPDYNITENSGEGFMLNLTGGAPSGDSGYNFEPGMLDPVKGKSVGQTNLGNMKLWINPNAHFFMDDWRLAQEQWAWITKTKFHSILTVNNLREHGCFNFAGGGYTP